MFFRKFGRRGILFLLASFVMSGFFWLSIHIFSLHTVEVIGDGVALSVDQKKLPKTLIFLDTIKLASQLAKAYPVLESIRIMKQYPHTIIITTSLRRPIAYITGLLGIFAVDREGVVLERGSDAVASPRIEIPVPDLFVGSKLNDPLLIACVQFLSGVRGIITIETVSKADSISFLAKTSTTDIFVPQDKNIETTVTTLQTLFDGFRIKGTLPTVIDLRFDKPVVKF